MLDLQKIFDDYIEKSHYELVDYHRNGRIWQRKQLKSDNTPLYNTPVVTSIPFNEAKEAKQKISEGGYKDEDITRLINKIMSDDNFVKKLSKLINHNHNIAILPMPSTTGRNRLPLKLAIAIKNKFGVDVITEPVVTSTHKTEAKKLRGLDKIINKRQYSLVGDNMSKYKNRDILIVDDIFTTGQSVNTLARELEKEGYHVPKTISIAKASTSFTSDNDIKKIAKMASEKYDLDYNQTYNKLVDILSKESSTIGYQLFQDVKSGSKEKQERIKNFLKDGKTQLQTAA